MDEDQPSKSIQGDIHITAPITSGIAHIGHKGKIQASNVSLGAPLPLDSAALKANLQELFGALSSAGLPMQTQMEAQTATGLAAQQAEAPAPQMDALAQHLQRAGQSLQRANVALVEGSQLAAAVVKLAHTLGPVVGGARIVASWFGLHLP